jgi:hypothetical protein
MLMGLHAVLLFVACNGPSGQFYVVQNQVPNAGCVIPAGEGALYKGEGILDIRVPVTASDGAYLLFPLLKNDLPVSGDGVEPNRIALAGFEVDLRFVDGPSEAGDFFAQLAADPSTEALVRYQSPWSGSVSPGGGTTTAVTAAFPGDTARRLRDTDILRDGSYARVDALVRAFGNKLDGRIKSDVFTYPIRICDGCLINRITTCPASPPILTGGVCNPGQDAPVDCCTQGVDLICPAPSAP